MNTNELKAFVQIEGSHLANGNSLRVVCPSCKAEHEQSFMIRKSDLGDLTGYCFRATCPIHGKVVGDKSVHTYEAQTSKFKPRVYEGQKQLAPMHLRMFLWRKYNIGLNKAVAEGVAYNEAQRRMVWPCYDKDFESFGHMTKAMPQASKDYPKWVTYFDRETVKLHYPRANIWNEYKGNTIVAVEDIISAVRIAQVCDSVALLGTHLTMDMVNELASKYDKLVIALDDDATKLAYNMKKKYGLFFLEGIDVAPMKQDPKDIVTDVELHNKLGVVKWE
jgi:hypothetical protein